MGLTSCTTCRIAVVGLSFVLACGCGGDSRDAGGSGPAAQPTIPFQHFDAGFFSIDMPRGWTVDTAGSCSTFALLIQKPDNPMWQIFYFGAVGPIYMSQQQLDIDLDYVNSGGFPIPWIDAPVVDPFTPTNFLAHWPQIAAMDAAAAFMPQFPVLAELTLVAEEPQSAMLPGATTGNARGLFTQAGSVGQGMFLATVKPWSPFTGMPSGGTGYGYMVCGVTAPKTEFAGAVARLIESLESFTITQAYVDNCLAQSLQIWGAVAAAGRTLSEASDIIYEGWQQRTHTEDILAEQRTDAFRDVERVYDPMTGTVYECPLGWYDDYDLHRGEYDMGNLQPLPDDAWELWMKAALEGLGNIH